MSHQRKRAFTLIEILVVVTIIAMLSAILLVAVNSGRGAANTAKTNGFRTLFSFLAGPSYKAPESQAKVMLYVSVF